MSRIAPCLARKARHRRRTNTAPLSPRRVPRLGFCSSPWQTRSGSIASTAAGPPKPDVRDSGSVANHGRPRFWRQEGCSVGCRRDLVRGGVSRLNGRSILDTWAQRSCARCARSSRPAARRRPQGTARTISEQAVGDVVLAAEPSDRLTVLSQPRGLALIGDA